MWIDCGGSCPDCFSCNDGILNQEEYIIDCGGACPCNEAESLQTGGLYGVLDLSFPSEQTGYLLGTTEEIFKTTDGGFSYSSIYIERAPFEHGGFDRIEFINEGHGMVIQRPENIANTSVIYVTRDGGSNWSYTIFDEVIVDIEILENEDVVLVTRFYEGGSNFQSGKIYKSFDGGSNWSEVYNSSDLSGNGVINLSFHNVELRQNDLVALAGPFVLESFDNGDSWNQTAMANIELSPESLQFRNERAFGLMLINGNETKLYNTADMSTWSEAAINTKQPEYEFNRIEFYPWKLIAKGDHAYLLQNDHEEYSKIFKYIPESDSWESYGAFHPDSFYPEIFALCLELTEQSLFVGFDLDAIGKLNLDD